MEKEKPKNQGSFLEFLGEVASNLIPLWLFGSVVHIGGWASGIWLTIAAIAFWTTLIVILFFAIIIIDLLLKFSDMPIIA